jgi:ketosteroid isomerase-like protein
MSEEKVEIVRRLYRAVDAWDTAAFADLTDPALEWVSDERLGEEPVRGRGSVIQYYRGLDEMFGELRNEIEGLWETDDQVLVFLRVTGSGMSSGASFDIRIAHLWTLRDGLAVRGEGYGDRDEALEAAGLRE